MWGGGSAFLGVFSFRGGGDLHKVRYGKIGKGKDVID